MILSLVQNLYFSPLSKFPGPFLWKAYRLRFVYSLISGNYVKDVRAIHEKYGDIVRLAPNEVSFAREDAWAQILSGPKHFPRNRLWYKPPLEQPDNIITTPNNADSSRMRRLIGRGMSVNACKKQEPIVQSYVDSFMSKLHALALSSSIDEKGPAGGTVNVTDWFNFFTFDVTGDLSFGESFDCLSDGKLHPWVFAIFKYIKGMAIAASARFYPFIEKLLLRCMPESIRRAHREHYQFTVDRVHKRLALGHERDDFMSSVIRDNKNFQNMSLPEIESTFAILVIAGSETTATTLAGTTNYLIQNPLELERLTAEVRSTFKMKEDITVAALEQLPILTATINEGLRLCNPVPAGIPYVVPKGGAWVCGHFLPEMVRGSPGQKNFMRHTKNPENIDKRFNPSGQHIPLAQILHQTQFFPFPALAPS